MQGARHEDPVDAIDSRSVNPAGRDAVDGSRRTKAPGTSNTVRA